MTLQYTDYSAASYLRKPSQTTSDVTVLLRQVPAIIIYTKITKLHVDTLTVSSIEKSFANLNLHIYKD